MNKANDLTNKDYEGFKNSMLTGLKSKIPEYTDFSDFDPGVTIIQLLARELDGLSYYNDRAINELDLDTAKNISSVLRIGNFSEYTPKGYTPAKFKVVFEIIPQTTSITIPKGFVLTTNEINIKDRQVYQLEEDLIIPAECNGLEKDGDKYKYEVSVIHGVYMNDVILGTSDGTKYQSFRIDDTKIISDSLEVWINEGDGFIKWDKVDNFINSFSNEKIYSIKYDGLYHYINFGGGNLGSIPKPFVDGIKCSYRRGGGKIGNVGSNTITKMFNPLAMVKRVFNPDEAYIKGKDLDDIEQLKIGVKSSTRAKNRAVTLEDFELLAYEQLPFVKKIRAFKNGDIAKLFILTDSKDGSISSTYMHILSEFYTNRKMINSIVELYPPTFIPLNISITLWISDNALISPTKNEVDKYIKNHMSLGNFNFGENINKSIMIRDIMNIPGVKSIDISISNDMGVTEEMPDNCIIKLGDLVYDIRGGINE